MDVATYMKFFIALALVLGLIALCAWLMRRLGVGGAFVPKRGSGRRLSVVEMFSVDPKRRLVLVRRDNREHLLLLGGTTELVIERDIAPPPARDADVVDIGSATTAKIGTP